GRCHGSCSCAVTAWSVPSRCLRKYSLPLAEEPNRLERHNVSTRGQFSSASGSSTANFMFPLASSETVYSTGSCPAASASSASASELRSNWGYDGVQPSRADNDSRSITDCPSNAPVPAPTVSAP